MAPGLRPEIRDFLYRHFETAAALEALLHLLGAEAGATVAELARDFGRSEDEMMDIVVALHFQGFLERAGDSVWRYQPRSEALGALVAEIARLPLSRLLAEIAGNAAPRSFAAAFHLRGKGTPEGDQDG